MQLSIRLALVSLACVLITSLSLGASQPVPAVLTQRGNNARNAVNLEERVLNVKTVESGFGKLWEYSVEGDTYAQPLFIPDTAVKTKSSLVKRNVLLVATMENFVYAFDADRPGNPLWRVQTGKRVSE